MYPRVQGIRKASGCYYEKKAILFHRNCLLVEKYLSRGLHFYYIYIPGCVEYVCFREEITFFVLWICKIKEWKFL